MIKKGKRNPYKLKLTPKPIFTKKFYKGEKPREVLACDQFLTRVRVCRDFEN
jgi:hypothetical protein